MQKILIAVLIVFCTTSAFAEESGIITDVSDRLEFYVKDKESKLELSSIYIPEKLLPSAVAKAKELAIGNEYNINGVSKKPNRHGNLAAIITKNGDKKSLQEHLIENGLAVAYFMDSSLNTKVFFAAENKARNTKLGIWGSGGLSVQDSKILQADYQNKLGEFTIVEGRVTSFYQSKRDTYINFGDDWKTDFTVKIENKILKKFPDFSVEKLQGKSLIVRGWLENYNGPFIKILNPANIEIM